MRATNSCGELIEDIEPLTLSGIKCGDPPRANTGELAINSTIWPFRNYLGLRTCRN